MDISSISVEERQRIIDDAMKDQLEHNSNEMVEKQLYEIKKYAVYSFYRRLSSEHKVQLLGNFITNTDLDNVIRIVRQLSHMLKLSMYSLVQSFTGFYFDKFLLDHDRALEEPTLTENLQGCVTWFRKLSLSRRSDLSSDLLLSSSGSVLNRILMPLRRVHNYHMASFPRKVGGKAPVLKEVVYETEADRARPECADVERLRRRWYEAVSKYRAEVQKAALDSFNMARNNDMDMIQFLPVWIVKKIFGYFDKSTMEVAKQVNRYWLETVRELQEELNTRVLLNKKLKIMKETIDPVKLEAAEREMKERNLLKKRRPFQFESGAIARSLHRKIPKRRDCDGIYTRILNKIYLNQEGELQVFPRCGGKHTKLDKYAPPSQQDINVNVGDDIEEQTSFLSYGCSTGSYSISGGFLATEELRAQW